jgi:hypothetical protein
MFEPDIELNNFNELQQARWVAILLMKTGDTKAAAPLLGAWRKFAVDQMVVEAELEAELAIQSLVADDYEQFIEHLTRAVDLGWRQTVGMSWTLDKSPMTRDFAGRPEFDALVQRIAADIAEQRARAKRHLLDKAATETI